MRVDYLTKKAFDREYILSELDKLSDRIMVPTQFFIIGGLALISYELKEITKDIDVILGRDNFDTLIKSLASINYSVLEDSLVFISRREMEKMEIMENKDGFKWDIFNRSVCNRLIFSDSMASRAIKFYTKDKLIVSVASKEDVFLFKGMTEREGDFDDMRLLAKSGLNWQVIKTECVYQSGISGRLWEDALLQKLIALRKRYGIRSPIEKELRSIAEVKLIKDFIAKSMGDGFNTIKNIAQKCAVSFCKGMC